MKAPAQDGVSDNKLDHGRASHLGVHLSHLCPVGRRTSDHHLYTRFLQIVLGGMVVASELELKVSQVQLGLHAGALQGDGSSSHREPARLEDLVAGSSEVPARRSWLSVARRVLGDRIAPHVQ